MASQFSKTNREGGGVCIFVKEEMDYIEYQNINQLSTEYIIEMCALKLTKFNMLLIVIYWPDSNITDYIYFTIRKNIEIVEKQIP